jgi:hypothetical protein
VWLFPQQQSTGIAAPSKRWNAADRLRETTRRPARSWNAIGIGTPMPITLQRQSIVSEDGAAVPDERNT